MSEGKWVTALRHRAFRITNDGLLKADNGERAPYRESTYEQDTVDEAVKDATRVFTHGEVVILPVISRHYVHDEESR